MLGYSIAAPSGPCTEDNLSWISGSFASQQEAEDHAKIRQTPCGASEGLEPNGQETEHVKIGHVKIDRAHFRVVHCQISREHCCGNLRGDPVVRFTQKSSTFMGISVVVFMYAPVCIFVSNS